MPACSKNKLERAYSCTYTRAEDFISLHLLSCNEGVVMGMAMGGREVLKGVRVQECNYCHAVAVSHLRYHFLDLRLPWVV